MRINVQCEGCGEAYTVQMADGIGTARVEIECPCGALVQAEMTSLHTLDGQTLELAAQETVRAAARVG